MARRRGRAPVRTRDARLRRVDRCLRGRGRPHPDRRDAGRPAVADVADAATGLLPGSAVRHAAGGRRSAARAVVRVLPGGGPLRFEERRAHDALGAPGAAGPPRAEGRGRRAPRAQALRGLPAPGQGRLWGGVEGDRAAVAVDGGAQEVLRRVPQRHGRAANVQGDHVPAAVKWAREHYSAAAHHKS